MAFSNARITYCLFTFYTVMPQYYYALPTDRRLTITVSNLVSCLMAVVAKPFLFNLKQNDQNIEVFIGEYIGVPIW